MKTNIFVLLLLFSVSYIGCKELTPIDDLIEIREVIPNPAMIGDTLSIFVMNINIPLNVQGIDQVKLVLRENNKKHIFPVNGYYDYLQKQEYGIFYHSKFIDSLALDYSPIIQCVVDSSYLNNSYIGVQLNEKILLSNIELKIK